MKKFLAFGILAIMVAAAVAVASSRDKAPQAAEANAKPAALAVCPMSTAEAQTAPAAVCPSSADHAAVPVASAGSCCAVPTARADCAAACADACDECPGVANCDKHQACAEKNDCAGKTACTEM